MTAPLSCCAGDRSSWPSAWWHSGLLMTALGGVGVEGARSNSGWLALITGMMCLPFGLMLTILGAAKWLRNRNLRRNR